MVRGTNVQQKYMKTVKPTNKQPNKRTTHQGSLPNDKCTDIEQTKQPLKFYSNDWLSSGLIVINQVDSNSSSHNRQYVLVNN